jgi:hypothetical protein
VTVKGSDPTPPSEITLETQGRPGGEITLTVGAQPVKLDMGKGDSFILRAIAEDPDGIKEVALWGTSEKTCEDPATDKASHSGPGLVSAALIKDSSAAPVGGTATSARYVSYMVKVDVACPHGPRFASQKFVFWGEAKNFSNVSTTGPKLTVTTK